MNYVTVKDLMSRYKISKTTVYNWIKEGMPSYKFGKLTRFKEEEVEKWLEVRTRIKTDIKEGYEEWEE